MKKMQEKAFSKGLTKVNEALIGKEPDWRDVEALIEILGDTEQGWGDIEEALGDTLDELNYHGSMDNAISTLTGRYSMTDEEATRVATTVQAYLQDEDVDLYIDWNKQSGTVELEEEGVITITLPENRFLELVRQNIFNFSTDDFDTLKGGLGVFVRYVISQKDWDNLISETAPEGSEYSPENYVRENKHASYLEESMKFAKELGGDYSFRAVRELSKRTPGDLLENRNNLVAIFGAFMEGFMNSWPDMGGIDFQESHKKRKTKKLKEEYVEQLRNIDEPIAALRREFKAWENATRQNVGEEDLRYFGYADVEDMIEEAKEELAQYIKSKIV